MSGSATFLLDADVLIQAKRHHYRFDVCAAVGVRVVNTFDMLADLGVVFSWKP